MTHIPCALRFMYRSEGVVEHFRECMKQIEDADLISAGHIQNRTRSIRMLSSSQIRGHTITDKREIARLAAVAINDARLVLKHVLNEDRHDCSILQFGI